MNKIWTNIPEDRLAAFCKTHHIKKLSLFGSLLHGGSRPDSDVDLLVEFESGHRIGLIRLSHIEQELSTLVGRRVDMWTPKDLSRHFREEVLGQAEVQYAQG